MAFADVGGRRLFYLRSGRGAPLLLVQGMAGHHRMWGAEFLALLEPHFDVIMFDHRGIGESGRADEPFTIADLADDAAGVLDAVGWADAHVLGISLGGMTAQELVLRHPDRVRTVTIGCSAAGGAAGVHSGVVRELAAAVASRDVERSVNEGFAANVSTGFAADPAHLATYRERALAVKVPAAVVAMQYQAGFAHDTSTRLPSVTTPTLVLHGTDDRILPVRNGQQVAALVPGARLELFADTGHLFWWEHPERAAALVLDHAGIVDQ